MRASWLVAILILVPLVAGCLTPTALKATAPPAFDATIAPKLDGKATLDELQVFAKQFPMRRGDNAAHNGARAYLLDAYKKAGYADAFRDELHAPVSNTATPTNAGGSDKLENVCAIHWGTTMSDEWIAVGAHYDVTDGAVYGTYDDGSGTMIVQHLARAFANVTTTRTILFCNFDGEEQGLRGSRWLVEQVTKGEWRYKNASFVGDVDFDMAGINYPAAPPLVADVTSPEMKAVIANASAKLGYPKDGVEYRAVTGGSSDNGPFKATNVSSVLFISDFDKVVLPGAPTPLPSQQKYPFWHQMDTYDGMVQLAGSEENLVKGTQNVETIGSALLYAMAMGMPLHFDASVG